MLTLQAKRDLVQGVSATLVTSVEEGMEKQKGGKGPSRSGSCRCPGRKKARQLTPAAAAAGATPVATKTASSSKGHSCLKVSAASAGREERGGSRAQLSRKPQS